MALTATEEDLSISVWMPDLHPCSWWSAIWANFCNKGIIQWVRNFHQRGHAELTPVTGRTEEGCGMLQTSKSLLAGAPRGRSWRLKEAPSYLNLHKTTEGDPGFLIVDIQWIYFKSRTKYWGLSVLPGSPSCHAQGKTRIVRDEFYLYAGALVFCGI